MQASKQSSQQDECHDQAFEELVAGTEQARAAPADLGRPINDTPSRLEATSEDSEASSRKPPGPQGSLVPNFGPGHVEASGCEACEGGAGAVLPRDGERHQDPRGSGAVPVELARATGAELGRTGAERTGAELHPLGCTCGARTAQEGKVGALAQAIGAELGHTVGLLPLESPGANRGDRHEKGRSSARRPAMGAELGRMILGTVGVLARELLGDGRGEGDPDMDCSAFADGLGEVPGPAGWLVRSADSKLGRTLLGTVGVLVQGLLGEGEDDDGPEGGSSALQDAAGSGLGYAVGMLARPMAAEHGRNGGGGGGGGGTLLAHRSLGEGRGEDDANTCASVPHDGMDAQLG